jgi:outer membrane protein OmpA-like peptidoglycan-associated protein
MCEAVMRANGLLVALASAVIGTNAIPSAARAQAPASPKIALVKGLRVGWAWHGDSIEGDYTPSMTVTNVDPAAVTIVMSARHGKKGGGMQAMTIDAKMLRSAMATGPIYRQVWITTDPLVMEGTTSMVLSDAVMNGIMTKGSAPLTIVDEVEVQGAPGGGLGSLMSALTSDSTATGTPYKGTMTRAEPGTKPFGVLVNDQHVTVPAIHLHGVLDHEGEKYSSDMLVLADPAFPLVLSHVTSADAKQGMVEGGRVVSLNFPDPDAKKRMEDDLAAKRPVEIYDIYFDYNSAAIKPESDSVLSELGSIMQRHPDWKLRVVGHTDSVGGSGAGNKVLSQKRAAAVKTTLTSRYGVATVRLNSDGAGDSQPLETNATLEGRARNRRVEIIRQ